LEFEQPVTAIALDPFQNIVNVGWGKGGKFAVLQFNSQWVAGAANTDDFLVDAPPVGNGLVHIYGNKANFRRSPNSQLLITSTVPFKRETVDVTPPSSFSQLFYHCLLSGPGVFADQWYRELTLTVGGQPTTTWVNVTAPPNYTPRGPVSTVSLTDAVLGDGSVFTSFSIVGTDGPYTGENAGYSVYNDLFNALIIFDLDAIKADIAPANTLTIGFTTGASPDPIAENHDIQTSYTWFAAVASFKDMQISYFFTDAQNRPTGWIGDAASSVTRSGQASSTRIDIDINLTTLSVTGH
jgi:hypothetical protein